MAVLDEGENGIYFRAFIGSVLVDDVNITIDCELPALARNFIVRIKSARVWRRGLRALLTA